MEPRPKHCGTDMAKEGTAESGRKRWKCSICGTRSTMTGDGSNDLITFDATRDETLLKAVKNGATKFIVTSAVNNSGRIKNGWESLVNYANYLGAEIAVIPISYKNVSLYTASSQYKKWWSEDLHPYLLTKDINLGGGVRLMVEKPVQATAVHPLSGLEAIGGNKTCIYGHPQLAMRAVASPANKLPKRLWTTGSITNKNYSNTKAGGKGEFHHVMSALIIEIEGKDVFIRVLGIDSKGEFYDLNKHITPDFVVESIDIGTLTTGDEHELFMLDSVRSATYSDKRSMVNWLKPGIIVRHDILDGYAGSHHHDRDPLTQYAKHLSGMNDYRTELDRVVKHINKTTPSFATNWIVASNHHDHLDIWLAKAEANTDHVNATLISELQLAARRAIEKGARLPALQLYLESRLKVKTKFLDRNKPAMFKGVDHSQHGDVGVNGSRGSAAGLAKTTYKATIGHSHASCIEKSVYQSGTSTGRLEYERGLSNHINTHIIQYKNGKRTTIDILNGKYCAKSHFSGRS